MPAPKPISDGTTTYRSRRAMARAKGVSVQAICDAERKGTLSLVGLGNAVRVKYKGKMYDSFAAAGRANGKTRQAIWLAVNVRNEVFAEDESVNDVNCN